MDTDEAALAIIWVLATLIIVVIAIGTMVDDGAAKQETSTRKVCDELHAKYIEGVCVKNDKVVYRP